MSGSSWLIFALAVVIFSVWEVVKRQRNQPAAPVPPPPSRPSPAAPEPPRRYGTAPHPAAYLTDLPGGSLRIVDLRGFPADALALGQIESTRAQLRLERPIANLIWVVDAETARAWAALPAVALANLAARLADPRIPTTRRFLYASGDSVGNAESAVLRAVGIEIVLEYTNLSDPPKSLDELAGTAARWAPSPENRPVPAHKSIATQSTGPAAITIVEGFGFVDLRRVDPDEWQLGTALGGFACAISELVVVQPLTHVVWVAAPWVLDRVGDGLLPELEALVASIPATIPQRLAIVAPQNELIGDYPLTRRLGQRLPPIGERMQWKTADNGVFDIRPLDALHDAYFHSAWAKRRKLREVGPELADMS